MAADYWTTRTPTQTGRVDPPISRLNYVGEPSTATGRQAQRIHDRSILSSLVQLAPDMLVVYDRKPWRIVEVREIPTDLWGDEWQQRYADAIAYWERYSRQYAPRPEKPTWRDRPVSLVLVPDRQPNAKPIHLRGPASHSWHVLPEHYAVCIACGELPPCSHEETDRAVAQQMAKAEELMAIPAGHCLGCSEAITSRMKAVRFPGPNLWRPDLGDDSAVFHARRECSGDVARYRKRWTAKGHVDPQPALPLPDAGDA